MSAFGGLILTNKGRALQAKAQTGTQLVFTKIKVGDGQLSGQSITDLTGLIHLVKELNITKFKNLTGGKAVVGCILSNSGLAAGFYWRELGVFAQDPTEGEILYCYGNAGANAEYIPADGGADLVEKNIDVITLIGNASNVSATIEQSLIYASAQDLLNHENDAVVHISQADRGIWNAKETPAGAQAKADAAASAVQGQLDMHQADNAAHGIDLIRIAKTSGGTANALTLDTAGTFDRTVDGNILPVNPSLTNTGAATMAEDGQVAKTIKKFNVDTDAYVDLEAGDIKKNQPTVLRWSVSNDFFVLAPKGGGKFYKSIQTLTGTISGSGVSSVTRTISPVDPSKTIVLVSSKAWGVTSRKPLAYLSDSTHLVISTRVANPGTTYTVTIIELIGVKSVQMIQTDMPTSYGVTTKDVTISAVSDTSKVWLICDFNNNDVSPESYMDHSILASITNASTLHLEKGSQPSSSYQTKVYTQVIEFN